MIELMQHGVQLRRGVENGRLGDEGRLRAHDGGQQQAHPRRLRRGAEMIKGIGGTAPEQFVLPVPAGAGGIQHQPVAPKPGGQGDTAFIVTQRGFAAPPPGR